MAERETCRTCGETIPRDAPGGACPRCALAAALPSPDAAGPTADEVAARLPGFEILGTLGRGGMGVVFKARQKALDRIVALKVLPPAMAAAPGFAERFQREAKAMARLAHPNIVAVHEFGDASGLFYLVLEYVDGVNLREAISAGRMPPKDALAIVPQICDALQYAHDHGVVHRDIKPENVLLTRDGRIKVADFGLAKLAGVEGDAALTAAGQVMGTMRYMAPEQWERPKDVDHRADIYSLGVVFYEMLTGELPVGRFEPPSGKCDVDARIDAIVLRTLERERAARFQHASEVKSRIGEASAPAPAPAPARVVVPPPLPARTEAARVSKLAIVSAICPILVAGFIYFVWSGNGGKDLQTREHIVFLWSLVAGFAGALLAIIAWVRLRAAGRLLHGRWLAAIGLVGTVVAATAAYQEVITADRMAKSSPGKPRPWAAMPSPPVRTVEGVEVPATVPFGNEARWLHGPAIEALVRRLQAIHPSDDLGILSDFYPPQELSAVDAMSAEVRAKKAAEGALGLPLLALPAGGPPLSKYRVVRTTVTADHATVQLADPSDPNRAYVAHLERLPGSADKRWVFSLAPVELLVAEPSSPMPVPLEGK